MSTSHDQSKTSTVQIRQLWTELTEAQVRVEDGESILERVSVHPWQSEDPLVRAAWKTLTSPANLAGLEEWGQQVDMNPNARKCTDKAIEECRKRKKLEQRDAPDG